MGGVEALDALIAYYRIHIRSKKYYHKFFFHFVDMVIVNSWLLYRRNCESLSFPRKKQRDLLAFRTSIAQALCMQGQDLSKKKRRMLKGSLKRRNVEVQLRLCQYKKSVQMLWVTGQWLKESGNAANSQTVRARLYSNMQSAMFTCASTKTTAFVNSTSKVVSCSSSDMLTLHIGVKQTE